MTPTGRLAGFVAETSPGELPAEVVAAAKVAILDGLANIVAGAGQPVAQRVACWATAQGGTTESTVVGGRQLPSALAAFVNGVAGHCLDYEVQGYPSAHGTSSILPAALALAERTGASGAALVTAYAVGWDVQQRLRTAGERTASRSFHPPGVVGPLGAVAAAASVLGLDAVAAATAFGLAASRAGGLFANNGTMAKALHPGGAARAGVECADLAALGVTSNTEILDAHRGFADALFAGEADWDAVTDGIGKRFHLVDPGFSIKPYPAEIYMQWPIDAAATLRARHRLSAEDIAAVVVEPPLYRADLSRPAPATGLDGKFSYEYCVTAALVQDRVGIGTFADAVRFSPAVEQTLPKVVLRENPDIPKDKLDTWARVTVHTHDGRELRETCHSFPGSVARPMDRDARILKVADCLASVGAEDRVTRLVDVVERLEEVEDLTELTALLG
ncbi:MmgE/PrpD family protein [Actinophytocola oryzae]|uniref:2-methylcitrate dehydratase PrpD n=1 Tax=Actinophytocola oryzae TaxID=502181 RepID=A0A4R7W7M4_9PSEU|nr:MmgE/PrpD family protein [Actinophytocola oryzae]TDV57737.1 2-methylcitrate dehydratase PrpD [Actinophytocola oryzae]